MNYGVSRPGRDLVIYVMTRTHLQKARNIAQNPSVSLVVPLTRRLLWFLPPPTIQLHGRAEIVDWTDEEGTEVFRRFWMGRRILDAYQESHRRGETRICFLKIVPDPVVYTYMVGCSIWQLRIAHGIGGGQGSSSRPNTGHWRPVFWLDLLLLLLIALTIVVSLSAVGNILVLALLITPAAAARLLH